MTYGYDVASSCGLLHRDFAFERGRSATNWLRAKNASFFSIRKTITRNLIELGNYNLTSTLQSDNPMFKGAFTHSGLFVAGNCLGRLRAYGPKSLHGCCTNLTRRVRP